MIFWTIINISTAMLVAAIVVYQLTAYHEQFGLFQRAAMGMIAAGMLLRIGPILGKNVLDETSPFDDWSVSLLHIGVALWFLCRLYELERGNVPWLKWGFRK